MDSAPLCILLVGDAPADVARALAAHAVVRAAAVADAAARLDDTVDVVVLAPDVAADAAVAALKTQRGAALLPVVTLHRDGATAHLADAAVGLAVAVAELPWRLAALARLRRQDAALRAELVEAQARLRLAEELTRRQVHDLLGPVAGVDGFLRLLQRDPADPEAGAMLGQALQAIGALRAQVEDLRRVHRLEDGALTPARAALALRPLVDAAAATLAAVAARRQLTLTVAGDAAATADPLLLGRALELALAAALAASPRRGEVGVRLATDGGGTATIEIADRGGAAPADRAAMFTRDGARAGLYLVALILGAHGGAATAHARDGGGTIVRLTVPGGG